jgi:large subunit ribosomal protein L13
MTTKLAGIKHERREVEAAGEVLGRLATKIAALLVGKDKPYFVRHLDCGDFVMVKNAGKVKITGEKSQGKIYSRYSGYPAGQRRTMYKDLQVKAPGEVIRRAVWGMLPNNKLRKVWIARLEVSA